MKKHYRYWIVLILIGITTSCRGRVVEQPLATSVSLLSIPPTPKRMVSALPTPAVSAALIDTPTPQPRSQESDLPTPFVPTATTESTREIPPTLSVTSTPVNPIALTPTPVYTITSVRLPDDCYGILPEAENYGEFLPCSEFKFSPDERYLGFFSGPDFCGRTIVIMDTQTMEIVYRSGVWNGLRFEFLMNGKVLISTGHCEGGQKSLLDLTTRELSRLGDLGGGGGWNASRTAIATETAPYQGVAGAIWGYNAERDFLFLPQPEGWQQFDTHLLWVPDGSHILYLHRPVSYAGAEITYTFPEPSQVIRVNVDTGEKYILAGDLEHNYYFCAGANNWCDHWYGDWIQVRRFPFEALSLEYTDDFHHQSVTTCLLYGIDCADPPELLALNWRTGELVPWDDPQVPALTPTPNP